MLRGEVKDNESARECYTTVEESYAERHEADEEISANWVSAAILTDSHAAPELAEAYLELEKAKGEMEEEIAEMTVESLQDGSYVNQVLMRYFIDAAEPWYLSYHLQQKPHQAAT